MNIALIGYGKMGQAIEQIALERGHQIVMAIHSRNQELFTPAGLEGCDVAIEFTRPDAAREHVSKCLRAGVPVVCGTTGWNEGLAQAKLAAVSHNTAFLHASNFSIGVNIFFEINRHLAALMNDQPDYDVVMEEIHHTQKKDSPSGTAITLAEQILENLGRKKHWQEGPVDQPESLSILAHREENVPGTHSIRYHSEVDDIEIIHTAHSRKGFALGAVLAAEFIMDKKGIFSMRDVLGISAAT
jgi:4-hydroxy-tetrahydrodipicolinate reductase